ncbi:MAG: UDP-N-acetylmuramoyl-tripeptide--D-alanyl-D-alanine ligase [Hyphomicrobiaceae bacterium]
MTAPLWTISEVIGATGGICRGRMEAAITGVSIDTRTLEEGDLFIAIKGENQDGHKYAEMALERGAAAVIVEEIFEGQNPRYIRVPDTLRAMEALGRAARARTHAKIIAVTGSVGKTGTKEMLRLALSACGRTHAAEKSYNNHWGVPLTLARMPQDTEYGVFEIGMNHPGEITPLTKMVRPHVAIVTAIAPVHIGYLGSLEAIAHAKAEIFDGIEPDGIAILNANAPHLDILEAAATKRGAAIRHFGASGAFASASNGNALIGEKSVPLTIGAPGTHHVSNALAVLTACDAAGVDLAKAAGQLARFQAPAGRGAAETITTPDGGIILIDESYNANPASVGAAITVLAQSGAPDARRIAVLGDMLELGEQSETMHAALAEPLQAAGIDLVFTCGPHMARLRDALPESMRGVYGETSDDLHEPLLAEVAPGDVVMIQGSLGSRMGPIVAALRSHLSGHTTTE